MVEFKSGTKLLWEAVFMLLLPLVKWNVGWKCSNFSDSYQASVKHPVKMYRESKKKKKPNKPNKTKTLKQTYVTSVIFEGEMVVNVQTRALEDLYLYCSFIMAKMSKWAGSPFEKKVAVIILFEGFCDTMCKK